MFDDRSQPNHKREKKIRLIKTNLQITKLKNRNENSIVRTFM